MIAARAEEHEPEDRSSGKLVQTGGAPNAAAALGCHWRPGLSASKRRTDVRLKADTTYGGLKADTTYGGV